MGANQVFWFPERRRRVTWCGVAIGRYFTLHFIQARLKKIIPIKAQPGDFHAFLTTTNTKRKGFPW